MEGLIPYIIEAIRERSESKMKRLSSSNNLLLGSSHLHSDDHLAVLSPRPSPGGRGKGLVSAAQAPNGSTSTNAANSHYPTNNIRKRYQLHTS